MVRNPLVIRRVPLMAGRDLTAQSFVLLCSGVLLFSAIAAGLMIATHCEQRRLSQQLSRALSQNLDGHRLTQAQVGFLLDAADLPDPAHR